MQENTEEILDITLEDVRLIEDIMRVQNLNTGYVGKSDDKLAFFKHKPEIIPTFEVTRDQIYEALSAWTD